MRNIAMILGGAVCIFALSCQKEMNGQEETAAIRLVPVTFSVENPQTKTALGEGNAVNWTAGDRVSLFDDISGKIGLSFEVSDGTIEALVSEGAGEFYSLYPYNASATISGNVLTTSIPSVQTAADNSFGEEVNIAVAYTTMAARSLRYANACALLKLDLGIADVASITVTANKDIPMSGRCTVSYSADAVSAVSCDGGYSVTLTKGGYALTKGVSYYMAVAPQTYTGGITLTLVKTDGTVLLRKATSDLSVSAGVIKQLGTLNESAFEVCDGYYAAFQAGMPLEICGELYDANSTPAYFISPSGSEKRLGNVLTQGPAAYFLDSAVEFDDRALTINGGTYILVGNNPQEKTRIVRPDAGNPMRITGGGSVLMKNIDATCTGNFISPTGAVGKIHLDGCTVSVTKNFYNYASVLNKAPGSIRIYYNLVRFTTATPMFALGGNTQMSDLKELLLINNIFSASALNASVLQYAGGEQTAGQDWSNCKMEIRNNISYGLNATNGLVRHHQVASLHIGGNIYVSSTGAGKAYYLFSAEQDKSLLHNDRDIFFNNGSATWVYSGNGNGQASGIPNALPSLAETPFSSFDTTSGAYELKADYVGYGPQL